MIETIEQGGTLAFTFSVTGDPGLSCEITVMQSPGDTPSITKTVAAVGNDYPSVLSSTDTAGLTVGYWYVHAQFTDSDEDLRKVKSFYVKPKWVG